MKKMKKIEIILESVYLNRLIELFAEQNIDLNKYLEPPIL